MNRRGFTIVELIIVIAIMGILLVLAVVNLRSTQANGRDSERASDTAAIALQLNAYYESGNSDLSIVAGSYPSTAVSSDTNANIENILRDIDIKLLLAPGVTTTTTKSFVSATNNTQTIGGVAPQPAAANDVYVYQPLQSDGSLCTLTSQICRKFNMYYWKETTSAVVMITSKNQ
jgi:prepilin-type N-terminal cleavage/methylation domain-containing protein